MGLLQGTLCGEDHVLEVFWWASFPLSHVTDRQQDAQTLQGGFSIQGLLSGPLKLQVQPALLAHVLASGPVGGREQELLRPPSLGAAPPTTSLASTETSLRLSAEPSLMSSCVG